MNTPKRCHNRGIFSERCLFELYWRALSHFPLLESFRGSRKLQRKASLETSQEQNNLQKLETALSTCLQYRIRRTVSRKRQVMEARKRNRCYKLNQQKILDANLKTFGSYSDLVTLSLTRMKTRRNYHICSENWRSCKSLTQISRANRSWQKLHGS